jgi:hypothetical protein
MDTKDANGIAFGHEARCGGARFLFRSARPSITHLQGEHSLSLPIGEGSVLEITATMPRINNSDDIVFIGNYAFSAEMIWISILNILGHIEICCHIPAWP